MKTCIRMQLVRIHYYLNMYKLINKAAYPFPLTELHWIVDEISN